MPRKDRTTDVQAWMDQFKRLYPEIEYVEDINGLPTAQYLDHIYGERLEESIRPRMKPHADGSEIRVDRHKIASLYEVIIAESTPIACLSGDDESEINPLNYTFAYFVAQLVIGSFNKARGVDLNYFVSEVFDREHMSLLEICRVSEGLVFSNAASWYLIEKYCEDKLALKAA